MVARFVIGRVWEWLCVEGYSFWTSHWFEITEQIDTVLSDVGENGLLVPSCQCGGGIRPEGWGVEEAVRFHSAFPVRQSQAVIDDKKIHLGVSS